MSEGIDIPSRPAKKKKKRRTTETIALQFEDVYRPTGQILGEGSCASVQTYKHIGSEKEYAVKVGTLFSNLFLIGLWIPFLIT